MESSETELLDIAKIELLLRQKEELTKLRKEFVAISRKSICVAKDFAENKDVGGEQQKAVTELETPSGEVSTALCNISGEISISPYVNASYAPPAEKATPLASKAIWLVKATSYKRGNKI